MSTRRSKHCGYIANFWQEMTGISLVEPVEGVSTSLPLLKLSRLVRIVTMLFTHTQYAEKTHLERYRSQINHTQADTFRESSTHQLHVHQFITT